MKSRISAIHAYPAGTRFGYQGAFVAPRDVRIAHLPVGWSDGVPLARSGRGEVLIRGARFPIVGQVSMSTLLVDVTCAPDLVPGETCVVLGTQGDAGIRADELAQVAGTSPARVLVNAGRSGHRVLRE